MKLSNIIQKFSLNSSEIQSMEKTLISLSNVFPNKIHVINKSAHMPIDRIPSFFRIGAADRDMQYRAAERLDLLLVLLAGLLVGALYGRCQKSTYFKSVLVT